MRPLALAAIGTLLLVIAEITAFVLVAQAIGWPWAVLLGIATGFVGALLLRREGMRAWRRFRAAVNEGRPPGAEVSDGLTGLLGALLLLTPGFLTDAAGLLLLLPPVRALARRAVRGATERRISAAAAGDLFGPRFVKAQRADPAQPAPNFSGASAGPGGVAGAPAVEGEVVEGEIIDPHPRRP
ncbi:FxsA family protein [Dactylosporangium sp. NPDC005572]|uniref:FxsA family protein n=1 Tax=Dactylosporangium sp. NPDC005572 TaxID=3156889 RepID=UPI0033ABDF90